jgi:AcrR family transcriptional regulator
LKLPSRLPSVDIGEWSKDGILLAVMGRGAERFFADLPDADHRAGRSTEHLRAVLTAAVETLRRHPSFLRLTVVFAVQPPGAGEGDIQQLVGRVRETALERLRSRLCTIQSTVSMVQLLWVMGRCLEPWSAPA